MTQSDLRSRPPGDHDQRQDVRMLERGSHPGDLDVFVQPPQQASKKWVGLPRWLPEILLLALLYMVYSLSRGLVDSHPSIALTNGWSVLDWELSWHLAPEFYLNDLVDSSLVLGLICSYYYATLHFIVTPAVLIWMYRKRSGQYSLARTVLAVGSTLALIGYYVVPTAPPRMLTGTGLSDVVSNLAGYGWWARGGSVPNQLIDLANPYAAMPSLHVAWALWCGGLLLIYSRRLWLRIAGVCYPLATTFVVLATANHYLFDAIAGGLVMTAALGIALAVRALRSRIGYAAAEMAS